MMNIAIMTQIDTDYNCTGDLDPEVKQRWYPTGIMLNYTPVFDAAHTFVSSMGRLKYLTPIYTALEDSGNHDMAMTWFNENKDFYHPVAVTSLEKTLGITESSRTHANHLTLAKYEAASVTKTRNRY